MPGGSTPRACESGATKGQRQKICNGVPGCCGSVRSLRTGRGPQNLEGWSDGPRTLIEDPEYGRTTGVPRASASRSSPAGICVRTGSRRGGWPSRLGGRLGSAWREREAWKNPSVTGAVQRERLARLCRRNLSAAMASS